MNRLSFPTSAIAAAILTVATTSPVLAQASYVEGFENMGFVNNGHGPDGLIAAGWEFRNQSEPVSSGDWRPWNYAYQGNRALHVDYLVSQWFNNNNAEASSWAILPAIPGQIAGDELRFFLSSVIPNVNYPASTWRSGTRPPGRPVPATTRTTWETSPLSSPTFGTPKPTSGPNTP